MKTQSTFLQPDTRIINYMFYRNVTRWGRSRASPLPPLAEAIDLYHSYMDRGRLLEGSRVKKSPLIPSNLKTAVRTDKYCPQLLV